MKPKHRTEITESKQKPTIWFYSSQTELSVLVLHVIKMNQTYGFSFLILSNLQNLKIL